MSEKLSKSALVTGGATGIGRAIALRLARAGIAVAILYAKSEREALETAAAIRDLGGRCCLIKADVTQPHEIDEAIRKAVAEHGGLDWLVNNAGITYQLPFADLDLIEDHMWDDLFATNVKGVFRCCRAAAPYLRASADGAILNTGSIAGLTGYGSSIPYAVSKAATHGLTQSLARALAPRIRVNALAPGAVATRWWAGNEDKMAMLAGKLPLERISTPEDIAETAFGVLSAASMTGQVIRLDNGQTL